MRRPAWFRAATVLVSLALLLAACSKGDSNTTPDTGTGTDTGSTGTPGGTLRIGSGGPDSINPFKATSVDSFTIFRYAYPFLVEHNATLDGYEGDLAENWEVSEDGLTWTFHLAPGAVWSDGAPIDSEDVKFSFELYQIPGLQPSPLFKHVVAMETPDPTTFVMQLDEPIGTTLNGLAFGYILPEQTWAQFGHDADALKKFANPAPWISGGSFILTEYKEDEITLFEKNPTFYGEKPLIDGFGLRAFTDDDALIAALENDEIDMVAYLPATGVQPLTDKGFEVSTGPGYEFDDIIFNSNPKKKDHPEIQDPVVRTAIEMSVDRERLVDVVQQGFAQPGASIVPPASGKWNNSDITPVGYDIDAANKALDEAGYARGSDGIRVTPGGDRMEYEIMTQIGQAGVNRIYDVLKEGLDQIGIASTQKPLNYNPLWEANQAPINEKTGIGEYLDFEIIIWTWTPEPDPDFILSVLQCNQYSIWSDTAYCDKGYDESYEQQAAEVDEKARKDLIWQMQQKLYDEKPYIVLYNKDAIYAVNTAWTGFHGQPDGPISSLNRISLTKAHQV